MAFKTPMGEMSGLAYYIRSELFDNWERERKQLLEPKWQRNLDAFNSISTGAFKPWKKGEGQDWRSSTFVAITKEKVLAGWSLVIDMLLQGGKIPFTLLPSPWDEVMFEDLPEEEQQPIKDAIEDMIGIINQQLCDCHADRHLMKNIMSNAIYGETYAKRFVHEVERTGYKTLSLAPEGLADPEGQYTRFEPYRWSKNAPGVQYVSVWDIFRDLETDDIQAGVGIIHRELTSPYILRQQKDQPFSIDSAIDHVIAEAAEPGGAQPGPQKSATLPPYLREIKHRHNTIERLEFWGRVPRELVETFEEEIADSPSQANFGNLNTETEVELDGDEVEIMAQLADNDIVRYARTEPSKRPFYRSVWEVKLDHVEATSVADNVEGPQYVLNGMIRAFEDNKKLAANVILALKERLMAPGALDEGIYPGMKLEIADECDDARKALQQIIIHDVGSTLLEGIGLFERYADESSQIPKLTQGYIPEKKKPQTAYELSQLLANAGKYIGGVIKNQDEGLIEPQIRDFLEYNMEDPELTKGKGNFIAKALGFTSFQNRALRTENLQRFLTLLLAHEILTGEGKYTEVLTEIAKSLDLEPGQVLLTPEEKEQKRVEAEQSEAAEQERRMIGLEMENKSLENEKLVAENAKLLQQVEEIREELRQEWEKIELEREKLNLEEDKAEVEAEQTDEKLEIEGIKAVVGLVKGAATAQ